MVVGTISTFVWAEQDDKRVLLRDVAARDYWSLLSHRNSFSNNVDRNCLHKHIMCGTRSFFLGKVFCFPSRLHPVSMGALHREQQVTRIKAKLYLYVEREALVAIKHTIPNVEQSNTMELLRRAFCFVHNSLWSVWYGLCDPNALDECTTMSKLERLFLMSSQSPSYITRCK